MQTDQVIGVVGEVSIHLENILVVAFQRPLETCDIGRAQSQFSGTFQDEEPVGELSHHAFHDIGGAIGTVVVDDEDIEGHRQVEDITDDLLDVFLFLIGWYND